MQFFTKLVKFILILVGIAACSILILLWRMGLFDLLTLEIPDGPIESHMYELRELYDRGMGIDDGVYAFILDNADVYLEPTLALIERSSAQSESEELALFYADMYAGKCSVRIALLKRALAFRDYPDQLPTLSTIHQSWDSVELFPGSDSNIGANLIRFHDAPSIQSPPNSWRSFGSKQYQGFFDEHNDYGAGVRFAASQLTSAERLELAFWLVSVVVNKPTSDQVMKALSESGSDYYVAVENSKGNELADHLGELSGWIVEAELEFVTKSCGTLGQTNTSP